MAVSDNLVYSTFKCWCQKIDMKLISTSHAHNLTDLIVEILDTSTNNFLFLSMN